MLFDIIELFRVYICYVLCSDFCAREVSDFFAIYEVNICFFECSYLFVKCAGELECLC